MTLTDKTLKWLHYDKQLFSPLAALLKLKHSSVLMLKSLKSAENVFFFISPGQVSVTDVMPVYTFSRHIATSAFIYSPEIFEFNIYSLVSKRDETCETESYSKVVAKPKQWAKRHLFALCSWATGLDGISYISSVKNSSQWAKLYMFIYMLITSCDNVAGIVILACDCAYVCV